MGKIGNTIKAARKQHGLTQQELGKILDLSRATISGIERGNISEVGIRKVARVLSFFGYRLVAMKNKPIPTLDDLKNSPNFFDEPPDI